MEAVAASDLGTARKLKRPKVLVVGAFPPPGRKVFGGMVTSCQALVESSFSSRFELVLVDSTQVSNPAPPFIPRAILAVRRFAVFLTQLVRQRPDAVVLFTALGASVIEKGAMAWVARLFGVPALVFPRGAGLIDIAAKSNLQRSWIRCALRGATHFLCQGPAWQRFAVDVIGFSPSRAPIVPNWTASEHLLAIGRNRLSPGGRQTIRILFLGWLEREKGIFELLQACAALSDSYAFELTIAGRGRAEETAVDCVRRSPLSGRTQFVGWVGAAERDRLLGASDVLILPSWAEGLPNAMIEAMAAGLAVVVSAVGNVPDVVTDESEALLVPPQNVAALQAAIQRLLDDRVLLVALAARGHAFVNRFYAVEPAVKALSDAIDSAIRSRHPCTCG